MLEDAVAYAYGIRLATVADLEGDEQKPEASHEMSTQSEVFAHKSTQSSKPSASSVVASPPIRSRSHSIIGRGNIRSVCRTVCARVDTVCQTSAQ